MAGQYTVYARPALRGIPPVNDTCYGIRVGYGWRWRSAPVSAAATTFHIDSL